MISLTSPTSENSSFSIRARLAGTRSLAAWMFGWTSLTLSGAATAQTAGPHPYRPGVDVVDYAVTLDLPDRGASIDGRAMLSIRRSAPLDTLVLDLVSMRVSGAGDGPVRRSRIRSVPHVPRLPRLIAGFSAAAAAS